jgi:hypothetical protein
VINSGALIRGALFHLEGRREPVAAIGTRIARTAQGLFERAAAQGQSPARVAVDEAEAVIEARSQSREGTAARRSAVSEEPVLTD